MKYYYLLEQINGEWHLAFGDYDRDAVKDEAEYIDNKTKIVSAREDSDIQSIINSIK